MAFFLSASLFVGCSSSSSSIFQKPAESVVLTQWVVVNKGMPILAAFHNTDGEEWMFFADLRPIVKVSSLEYNCMARPLHRLWFCNAG